LDNGCKVTRGHSPKSDKVRSNRDVIKYFFKKGMPAGSAHDGCIERYKGFKNQLQKIEKPGWVFMDPPMSLTCGLTADEVTRIQVKNFNVVSVR